MDLHAAKMIGAGIACIALVAAAVLTRVLVGWPRDIRWRGAALAGTGGFALFFVLWLPSGPLGSEWARRAGTPAALLGHSHTHAGSSGGQR